jgi:DNA polymerase-3 subunit alpha (Gram-positive type)
MIHPEKKTWTLYFESIPNMEHVTESSATGKWRAIGNRLELRFDKPVVIGLQRWEQIRRDIVRLDREKNGWTVVLHFDPAQSGNGGPSFGEGHFMERLLPFSEFGNGKIMRISEIRPDQWVARVCGKVFNIREDVMENGKASLLLWLTDFTGSILVRVSREKREGMEDLRCILHGAWLEVCGKIGRDPSIGDLVLFADRLRSCEPLERRDDAPRKRIELHLHTSSSRTGGVFPAAEIVKRVTGWGHPAVAITDHGSVDSFYEAHLAGKRHKIRIIYGMEAAVVDDLAPVVLRPRPANLLEETYVVFDVETTGLSTTHDRIIELAAVKCHRGQIVETFESLIRAGRPIPEKIRELTGIDDKMLDNAPEEVDVVHRFLEFAGNSVLVAHHVNFDLGFFQEAVKRSGLGAVQNPAVDTLELARILFPECSRYRLAALCEYLGIPLRRHHRALDDAMATAELWNRMLDRIAGHHADDLFQLNDLCRMRDVRKLRPFHAVILAKSAEGIGRLAELAKLPRGDRDDLPRIPRSELLRSRKELLIGSGGDKGELFQAALHRPEEEVRELARFYDYIEIQPIGKNRGEEAERIKEANRLLVRIGDALGLPVIAAGNVRYLDQHDEILFRILAQNRGAGWDTASMDAHFLTTEEMVNELSYLGWEKAWETVVLNPSRIAQRLGEIRELPADLIPAGKEVRSNEREALHLVKQYQISHGQEWGRAEVDRLVLGCLGRKI